MNKLIIFFLLFTTGIVAQTYEYEHIVSYHGDIDVQENCDVIVTEIIKVYANGEEIKRGIYRDIPLSYKYRGGNVHVGFEILGVARDYHPESFHTEWLSNGIRIYIGDKDVYLLPGYYTYIIQYRVDNVIGVFDDFDEIYWNINGNGWGFMIDQISATVRIPKGAKLKQYGGYTGEYGAADQDFEVEEKAKIVEYKSTTYLNPGENLSVAVAWDKGHLDYPEWYENLFFWIRSYILWFIGLSGLFLTLTYNTYLWFRYGKDPKPGTIIPVFYAPPDFSPAECAFLKKGGKEDETMFTAQLVGLATKGFINITAKKSGSDYVYYIIRNDSKLIKGTLNEVENKFFTLLFGTKDVLYITDTYNARVKIAHDSLIADIRRKQKDKYFKTNDHLKIRHYIIPLIALLFQIISYQYYGGGIWVMFVTSGTFIIVNWIYNRIIRQPTIEGREKMDQIAGFEMYMKYADKLRLKAVNPPSMDFTYFEKNLAYAIALGVADYWRMQFPDETINEGVNFHMPYMSGVSIAHLSSFTSSMESTISSASTPPGSSSGSGGSGFSGGGFSGGGGGGGGGGGW